jgi:hypothetical protein
MLWRSPFKNVRFILIVLGILIMSPVIRSQSLVLMNYNDGNRVVNDGVINIDTTDLSALELNAHLRIQNNTDKTLAIFMKKIINQVVDSTSNYFCLNPKCWPDDDSTDIADSIPAGLGDSSFVTHYDHFFRYERPIPPGFTSITYLFYDYTTLPEHIEARVTINYSISGVGRPEVSNSGITAYPVPGSEQVRFSSVGPDIFINSFAIYDRQGRCLRNLTKHAPLNEFQLDVLDFDNGMYEVVFHMSNGEIQTRRIIVLHV